MASAPIGTVQGLASGIQWQDMIDQLMQADTTSQITPITDKITAETNQETAWTTYGTAVSTLQSTLKTLMDGTAFSGFTVNAPASGSTGRTVLTATAGSTATPGTYGVQVLDTAAAQQLSGNLVSDATAALNVSGQMAVGGKVITIAASDSLNSVRDKINALNTGATPTHVSASVLFSGGATARLVLTSDIGGSAGLDLRDVRAANTDPSVLAGLGFFDGKTANVGSDGTVNSAAFSSSSQTISTLISGVTSYPAASTILVNGQAVTIDVQNNSLTDIAAAINAKSPNSASVQSNTSGGVTTYSLKISGTVTASANAGSQPILDLLGLSRGTTGAVNQQVTTTNVLQDSGGSTAGSLTTLLGLKIAGGNGAQLGDTFTISGTKGDGSAVSLTETVDNTKTVADMLNDISAAFSVAGHSATAAIVGGKIQLTDATGGDSQLSFSIAANNESGVADPVNGANVSFGSTTVTTGRLRQLTAGKDARILVNGVLVTRNTNSISDAITGVTLNLQQAEVGTTIQVLVARDNSKVISAVQNVASAYNAVRSLVTSSTAPDGALAYDSSMRSSFNALKTAILGNVPGVPVGNAYNNVALIGVTVDKTGVLNVDTTALTTALTTNADAVKALFSTNAAVTGANLSYVGSGNATATGGYDIQITRAATNASVSSTANNFSFAAAGAGTNTMTVGDAFTGHSASITLTNGDTPDLVAAKLNASFLAQGVRATASSSAGTLKITGQDFGASATLSVSYASTDATDIAGQLGIATGTVNNGLDVQGTYSSGGTTYAATGSGQALIGAVGTPVEGLIMNYAGLVDVASGHVDFATGLAGLMSNLANSATAADGTVATQNTFLASSIATLQQRQTDTQSRLDAKRASLTAQFTAMESAISKLQSQGTYLTQQFSQLSSLNSSGG